MCVLVRLGHRVRSREAGPFSSGARGCAETSMCLACQVRLLISLPREAPNTWCAVRSK